MELTDLPESSMVMDMEVQFRSKAGLFGSSSGSGAETPSEEYYWVVRLHKNQKESTQQPKTKATKHAQNLSLVSLYVWSGAAKANDPDGATCAGEEGPFG